MARRRRPGDEGPQPIASSLDAVAKRLTRVDVVGFAAILEVFDEVAGKQIAAHARPVKLLESTLVVAVDQPIWAGQLRRLSGELRRRLEEASGTTISALELVVRAPGEARGGSEAG